MPVQGGSPYRSQRTENLMKAEVLELKRRLKIVESLMGSTRSLQAKGTGSTHMGMPSGVYDLNLDGYVDNVGLIDATTAFILTMAVPANSLTANRVLTFHMTDSVGVDADRSLKIEADSIIGQDYSTDSETVEFAALWLTLTATSHLHIDAATTPHEAIYPPIHVDLIAAEDHVKGMWIEADVNGHPGVELYEGILTLSAIGAGEVNVGLHIIVDTQNATGGMTHGLQVDKIGTGTNLVAAVGVYAGVDVLHQHVGTWGVVEQAWDNDGGWLDVTAAFNAAGVDVTLFDTLNDYVYIGQAAQFESIEVLLDTVASGAGIKPTFEYSTGAGGWASFGPSDATRGFRNNGTITWLPSDLAGWVVDTVNAVANKYWIRIRRIAVALTTPPIEDLIQVLSGTMYSWDLLGDVTIRNLIAAAVTFADLDVTNNLHVGTGQTPNRINTEYPTANDITIMAQNRYLLLSGEEGTFITSNYYWDGAADQRVDVADSAWVLSVRSFADALILGRAPAGANPIGASWVEFLRVTNAGQLQIPITTIAGGVLIGGDFQWYRNAANVGRTPDSIIVDLDIDATQHLHVGTAQTPDRINTEYPTVNHITIFSQTNDLILGSQEAPVLASNAYSDGVNAISITGNAAIWAYIKYNTPLSINYDAPGAAGRVCVFVNYLTLNITGQLQLPMTGVNAGIIIGGDVQLYRHAANLLVIKDATTIEGVITANTHVIPGLIDTNTLGSTGFEWLNLYIGTAGGIYFGLGQSVKLSLGAANRLDLATGDDLNLVNGVLMVAGVQVVTAQQVHVADVAIAGTDQDSVARTAINAVFAVLEAHGLMANA